MKFTEAFDKLLANKKAKARLSNWRPGVYIQFDDEFLRQTTPEWSGAYVVELEDAKAGDWEIVEG